MAKGNLARVLVYMGKNDEETCGLLKEIALKDGRSEWVAWANRNLKLMRKDEDFRFELFKPKGAAQEVEEKKP